VTVTVLLANFRFGHFSGRGVVSICVREMLYSVTLGGWVVQKYDFCVILIFERPLTSHCPLRDRGRMAHRVAKLNSELTKSVVNGSREMNSAISTPCLFVSISADSW